MPGRILVVGFASGEVPHVAANMVLVKNFSVTGVVFGEHSWRFPDDTRARLAKLLDAYCEGRLRPAVMRAYPLAEAAVALAEMSSRRVMGKLVLVHGDPCDR